MTVTLIVILVAVVAGNVIVTMVVTATVLCLPL